MSLILDLIFPKICYGCGEIGGYLCPKCQNQITVLNSHPPKNNFNGGLSLFKYQGPIKSAIIDLKYSFISNNTNFLSKFMAQTLVKDFPNLVQYWQQNDFILVPIPLHPLRQNWRGFNQSNILAQQLSHQLSLKFSNQILIRHQYTLSQAKIKNSQSRAKNVSNIFSLNHNIDKFKNKNFIIFDDVSTTQATLTSARRSLNSLSPNQCWYLTLSAG